MGYGMGDKLSSRCRQVSTSNKVLYKMNLFSACEINVEKFVPHQMMDIVEKDERGIKSEANALLKALSERHFNSMTPPQKRPEFEKAIFSV